MSTMNCLVKSSALDAAPGTLAFRVLSQSLETFRRASVNLAGETYSDDKAPFYLRILLQGRFSEGLVGSSRSVRHLPHGRDLRLPGLLHDSPSVNKETDVQ